MIPDELKALQQWVTWRNEGGTKVPSRPVNRGPWMTYDQARWECLHAGQWSYNLQMGFVFTKDDPYVGIDLDDCVENDGTTVVIKDWAAKIISEAGSYAEFSPSKTGVHIICRGPHVEHGRNKCGIEVYSHGRYFTMTGNVIKGFETINDATALVERLTARERHVEAVTQVKSEHKPHNYMERAMSYAAKVPGAVSGQGGHDATYELACKLCVDFGLTQEEAMKVLKVWNETCSPPWTERELDHKIRSAMRKAYGDNPDYLSAYIDDQEDVEFSASLLANSLKRANEIPPRLLDLPGVLGDFTAWALTQNHRRNKVLSALGAIAWMAHLTGRKVQDTAGLRTNLYIVGLAPSAGGKQAPLECIKLLAEYGNSDSVIGKVTSDSAIARQLKAEPATLSIWDEFGLFLQKTGGKTGSPMGTVQDCLLELWGCTRTTWKAKTFADSERDIKVVQPCFSFLGVSTPDHFWAGLTRMHMRDGFAGRLLVVDSGPRAERGEVTLVDPPGSLIEAVRYWSGGVTGNLAAYGFGNPNLKVCKSTPGALDVFEELLERVDEETDEDKASVWGRAIEKARKLAMLWACAIEPGSPVVDEDAARWGVDFVVWATESFLARVEGSVVGDADNHSRITREVLAEIRNSGKATKKSLLRTVGGDAKTLASVLDTLVQADMLSKKNDTYFLR